MLTGPLKGFELYLYLRRGELSYWIGTFESSLQLEVVRLAEDTLNIRTIYDIGAHIGYFSLLLANNFKEARIVAFEPSSDNCARLKTNILLNDLQNDIQVFPWAITDRTGEASFYTPESSWSGSLLEHHRSACKRKMVKTWSLDDLVYQQGFKAPDLIKIDVEGAEMNLFRGATRLLTEYGPILLIETHDSGEPTKLLQLLQTCGYNVSSLENLNESPNQQIYSRHFIARKNVKHSL